MGGLLRQAPSFLMDRSLIHHVVGDENCVGTNAWVNSGCIANHRLLEFSPGEHPVQHKPIKRFVQPEEFLSKLRRSLLLLFQCPDVQVLVRPQVHLA